MMFGVYINVKYNMYECTLKTRQRKSALSLKKQESDRFTVAYTRYTLLYLRACTKIATYAFYLSSFIL